MALWEDKWPSALSFLPTCLRQAMPAEGSGYLNPSGEATKQLPSPPAPTSSSSQREACATHLPFWEAVQLSVRPEAGKGLNLPPPFNSLQETLVGVERTGQGRKA